MHEFEAELRRLVPVAPSERVTAAIARRVGECPASPDVRYVWWALPIAAALAVFAARWSPDADAGRSSSQRSAAFRPIAAEYVVLSTSDDGVVTLADGTPARQVRVAYLDTITWQNSSTNARLKWTLPREEVRIVPVTYQ